MASPENVDIPYIARHLQARKGPLQRTVLILGARTGGLFRSSAFYETLKQFGNPSFSERARTEQFAECYHILTQYDTQERRDRFNPSEIDAILEQALASSGPQGQQRTSSENTWGATDLVLTEADLCLAELIKFGLFDCILSTGVDAVTEKALAYVGLRKGRDFVVWNLRHDTDEEVLSRREERVPCVLINVFGQLTTRKYSIKQREYLTQNRVVYASLQEQLSHNVLAVGLDPVWDAELLRLLPLQTSAFFWLIDDHEQYLSMFARAYQQHDLRPFKIWQANYDTFFTDLYHQTIETNALLYMLIDRVMNEVRDLQESVDQLQSRRSARGKQEGNRGVSARSTKPLQSDVVDDVPAIEIFVAFHDKDTTFFTMLKQHLSALKWKCDVWDRRKVGAGHDRSEEIKRHLERASVVLLLISSHFIDAPDIDDAQITRVLERYYAGQARLIPIILRPVAWKSTLYGDLVPLPESGKALELWPNRHMAFVNVVEGIQQAIEDLYSNMNE